MYYNEIRQPDGTPIIGINYEEERPPVVDVLHTNETQQVQQQEPEYQLFDSQMITWFTLFLVLASIHYIILYDALLILLSLLYLLLSSHPSSFS